MSMGMVLLAVGLLLYGLFMIVPQANHPPYTRIDPWDMGAGDLRPWDDEHELALVEGAR